MTLILIGVELAKNVFQVHGIDRSEKPVWRRKLSRASWLKTLLETVEPGCEIGMEACGGAHDWARRLQAHGYEVRLFVKGIRNSASSRSRPGVLSDKWLEERVPCVSHAKVLDPAGLSSGLGQAPLFDQGFVR